MQPASPQPNGNATRFQKVLLGVLLVLVLGSTLIPLAYGQSLAGDRVFTGASRGVPDHGLYMSIMQQGASGAWRTLNLMSADPQNLSLRQLFFVTMGHIGGALNISMPVMYHIARLLVGAGFIFLIWRFCRKHIPEPAGSVATLFVFLAGGLGWTPIGDKAYSVDLWFSEANTYLTLYYWPHLTWALLLKTIATLAIYEAIEERDKRYAIAAGVACAILAFDHPMDLVGLALVYAAYAAIRLLTDRKLGRPLNLPDWGRFVGYAGAIGLPFALYVYVQAKNDPLQALKMTTHTDPVPGPWPMLLGFGILLPLAAVPAIAVWKGSWEKHKVLQPLASKRLLLFLYVWAAFNLFAMYIFYDAWFARRLALGCHPPIAILAALGFVQLLRLWSPTMHKAAVFSLGSLVAAFTAISHGMVFKSEMEAYDRGGCRNGRFYLTHKEIDQYRELGKRVPKNYFIQPLPGVLDLKSPDPMQMINMTPPPDLTMLYYGPWLHQHQEVVGHPWESPHYLGRINALLQMADGKHEYIVAPIPK